MLQTRSDALRVWVVNTDGAGGSSVIVTNTPLPVIINNSGGLYAMQSGAWNVSSTILNSAGWIVNVANTNNNVNIINSAGWIITQANTVNNVNIINSAGWVFNQANTGGRVIVNNSALYSMQSGAWAVSATILNSAGWVVNVANTNNIVSVANSAGWVMSQANTFGMVVFIMDSGAVASAVTAVSSTVGTVTLSSAKNNRVALSIYNASANPLFMKLGAGATTASYTLMMVASGYYEMARPIYEGIVTGIWQTANGQALVTETT